MSSPGKFTLETLYEIICDRRDHPLPGSYTASLLGQGENEIVKKIGEEAIEVILASTSQGDRRLVEEIADLYYHILVLLASRHIALEDIYSELSRRHKPR